MNVDVGVYVVDFSSEVGKSSENRKDDSSDETYVMEGESSDSDFDFFLDSASISDAMWPKSSTGDKVYKEYQESKGKERLTVLNNSDGGKDDEFLEFSEDRDMGGGMSIW